MSFRRRVGVAGLIVATAVAGLLALAPSAMAAFHLMKIREVDPATNDGANDGFVELQMWQSGQNFTAGHTVRVYDVNGAVLGNTTLGNVANGANQARILIAEAATVGGTTADFVDTTLNIPAAGGAVCFPDGGPPPDCVTWGAFTPQAGFPNPQSAHAAAPAAGQSLTRSIANGCMTLLEDPQDDTNNSSADFAATAPTPQANSSPIPETDCVLTVDLVGNGVGTVTGPGINCEPDCTQTVAAGGTVLLTATPTASTGSTFDAFGFCDNPMGMDQCEMTLNMSKTVLAEFDPPTMPQLTVVPAGAGSGTVMGGNINCPGTCMDTFMAGAPVSITANPGSGSTFTGWTGCPSGAGSNPCTYNADLHRTITANFSTIMNPPPVVPTTPATPATPTAPAPKRCKKGQKLKKGKCVKKKRKKK